MKKRPSSGDKKQSPSAAVEQAPRASSAGTRRTQPSAALMAAKKKAQTQKKTTSELLLDDPYQVAEDSKTVTKGSTAVVTDPRMADHLCLWDRGYPECPERLTHTVRRYVARWRVSGRGYRGCVLRCEELGLLDRCMQLTAHPAEESDVLSVHTPQLADILKQTSGCDDLTKLEQLSSNYDAIYIHPTSYDLALLAAGSATSLVETVCKGTAQNGMALIRPPGHHAMESEFCGYCFFNNAALAARRALDEGWASRVLLVDWDVHHGQASQQAFYDDPRVLYFSIHRYEHGEFWPNLEESNFHYIGEGKGRGFNVNVPLNSTGMGDSDYLAIFHHLLLPLAHEFQPDLVMVSAGYDAALGCPEFYPDLVIISAGYDSALGDEKGEMRVSPACYGHLTNLLSVFAGGKVAVLLEGGYCLRSLAESAAMTLRALLGDPCPQLHDLVAPCDSIRRTILDTMYALRPYWEVFKQQPTFTDKEVKLDLVCHVPKVVFQGPEPAKPPFATRDCYPLQSDSFKQSIDQQLTEIIGAYRLGVPAHRVGLVYSDGVLAHRNEQEPGHVESPQRAAAIFAKHEEYQLLERCLRLEARQVTEEELLMVHSRAHVNRIRDTSGKDSAELSELAESFNSIYLHPSTWSSAELAAGCVLEAVDAVMTGTCLSSVAIVRPPGHHAEPDEPCGFCMFNNVALAAQYAVNKFDLKRVLILDWDVHHGNGTQRIFESDHRVMYISLHRYDNGSFFPATISPSAAADAAASFVGKEAGKGYTINIPWNKRGMGDSEYVAAFLQVVLPVAYQFDPELVLISAGFDAAVRDPLGGCRVSPEMYGQMTRWLHGLAGGRMVVALEGGYNVSSIAYSLTMCTKALLGDPVPRVRAAAPCASAVSSIRSTQRALLPYWSSLCMHTLAIPAKDGLVQPGRYEEKGVEDLADALSAISLTTDKTCVGNHCDVVNPVEADGADKAGKSSGAPPESASQPGEPAPSGAEATNIRTLQDFLAECLKSGEEMYAVVPRATCPHLGQVEPVPEGGVDIRSPCRGCANESENWVCLTCYSVFCGRYAAQHMETHSQEMLHPLALSQADISVWCYGCDAYVDAPALYEAKNSAHQQKFGEAMPWTYGDRATIEMT